MCYESKQLRAVPKSFLKAVYSEAVVSCVKRSDKESVKVFSQIFRHSEQKCFCNKM